MKEVLEETINHQAGPRRSMRWRNLLSLVAAASILAATTILPTSAEAQNINNFNEDPELFLVCARIGEPVNIEFSDRTLTVNGQTHDEFRGNFAVVYANPQAGRAFLSAFGVGDPGASINFNITFVQDSVAVTMPANYRFRGGTYRITNPILPTLSVADLYSGLPPICYDLPGFI